MSAMFRSFSIFNYRVWFIGALVSNIGAWMQATAQNWVVLTELTNNDAAAMGVTMALQFGPPLLLVHGTADAQAVSGARRLQAARPDARLLLVEGMDHALAIGGDAEGGVRQVAAAVTELVNRLGSAPQVRSVSELDERSTSPDGRIGTDLLG